MKVIDSFFFITMFEIVSSRSIYVTEPEAEHCPIYCSCDFVDLNFDCTKHNLSQIPEHIYPNVTTLNISYNRFNEVPKDVANLKNLQHLDISNNPDITVIEINFISTSLKTLQLRKCSVDYVDNSVFRGLPSLESLNLSENPITSLNNSLSSKSLRSLDLSRCTLKHIKPKTFLKFDSLSYLYLNSNPNLKQFHCESDSVFTLVISNCNLEHAPSGTIKKLVELDMHGNNIQWIRNKTFTNMTNIENLNISYNAVRGLDINSFFPLVNLGILDLSYNRLTVIDRNTFKKNQRLKSLYLSHNYLQIIEGITSKSLEFLDISSCELNHLKRYSLINLPHLIELHLTRNQISHIPDHLEGPHLVYLDISYNDIASINEKTFASLRYLRFLKLSGNKLTSVEPNFFSQVIDIAIEDNPWLCDCDMLHQTYNWMIKTDQKIDNLQCQLPAKMEGLTWEQACNKTWIGVQPSTRTVWMYSVPFLLTFCVLVLLIYISKVIDTRRKAEIEEENERRLSVERQEFIQRQQTRERLRRLQEQEETRNRPDPRESVGPPTYNEALLLPRLDASHPSLASLAGSQPSLCSVHSSNPEISKRRRQRRKRRRRKSLSQSEIASNSNQTDGSDNDRVLSNAEVEESSF